MKIRKAIVLVTLAAATAFTVGLVAPALATAAKKPDLVVDPGRLTGRGYDVIGKRYKLSIRDATKNKGRKTAGPSTTMVFISPPIGGLDSSQTVSRRAVPGLRPGEKDRGSPRLGMVNEARAGKYDVFACADWKDDVNESEEGNNCAEVRGGKFYSVYETYKGTLSGSSWGAGFTPDTTETWSSANAEIKLTRYVGKGSFIYYGSGGTVTYTESGSYAGCTYSGGGSHGIDSSLGGVLIQHRTESHLGGLGVKYPAFQVQQNCGGLMTMLDGPFANYLMYANSPGAALPFGSTALEGRDSGVLGEEYSWDLRGRSAD